MRFFARSFLCVVPLLVMAPVCDKTSVGNTMKLTSPSFVNDAMIPALHTCEGQDQSPPLSWTDVPKNSASLALIVEDPDAPRGTFVHWVAWNIDPKAGKLSANISKNTSPTLLTQGTNSASKVGYMGPCPPSGTHRYFFTLYALDLKLDLPSSTTKEELLLAMKGHMLGQAKLMGKFLTTK